jgi:ubiquinone/menaquinone biosynthesis C-methylase UbiE
MTEDKQRFADEFGAQYDIFHEAVPWHDEFQYSVVKVLKEYFGDKKDVALVEAGFGTGITTKMILDEFPEAKIIAIDNVANMAEKTKEYVGEDKLANTQLVIGDLYEEIKKIPSETIDGFYSGYVLHNINHEIRNKILSEIYRVLKPGGVYSNGDRIAMDDPEKQKFALAQAIANCSIFLTKHNDPDYYLDWVRHYLRDEEPDLIFRAGDQAKQLEEIGFKEIEYVFQKELEQTCKAIK